MKTTLLSILLLICNLSYAQSKAVYNITFQSTWNATDHGTLPSNAHWSDLVGATHNSNITFLEMGQPASEGIEDVAEIGNDDAFEAEVMNAINLGFADQWFDEDFAPFAAISSASLLNVEVSEDFPLLTLASMIAPSPDWMIAINSFNLRDNGTWINTIEIDMYPYDAGTENGFGYSTSNTPTNPQDVITNIAGAPGYPFNNNKIGTLTIELQQELNISSFENRDDLKVYPNPTKNWINISNVDNNTLNKIEIYNILGKVVYEAQITDKQINIESLNNGIYMIKFYFIDDKTEIRKIIKQ